MGNMVSWVILLAYSPRFTFFFVIRPSIICDVTFFAFLKNKVMPKPESQPLFAIFFLLQGAPSRETGDGTGKAFIMITHMHFQG